MTRTSEYVSLGHPDRIADYLSSYLLDRYIEQDPNTKYAVEVQIKDKYVTLGGEITSSFNPTDNQIKQYIKDAYKEIGYSKEYQEYWGEENVVCDEDLEVTLHLSQQSPDINQGVVDGGWGDQGIFYGYARKSANIHSSLNALPFEQKLAILFMDGVRAICKEKKIIIGLDMKSQVTKEKKAISNDYDHYLLTFILAVPCKEKDYKKIQKIAKEVAEVLTTKSNESQKIYDTEVIVNGTGSYVMHGSKGDCGTTGRKLAVNFYGGQAPIGGGCPWTKDGSKADLTLNLYARHLARKYMAYCCDPEIDHVIVSLACCIGQKWIKGQIAFYNEKETKFYTMEIKQEVSSLDLINKYKLNTPIYAKMCESNLFLGDFKWEKL